eukprot:m.28064 g.28064  ORF g.28064 m.28064 type:complete len:156 (-) comp6498_c0_seq1:165-632(-)
MDGRKRAAVDAGGRTGKKPALDIAEEDDARFEAASSAAAAGRAKNAAAAAAIAAAEAMDTKNLSKADKRAHHNALERKRRDHIKDSFTVLRDSIPSLTGEKSSRAQILNKATDFIVHMRKKNLGHQDEMERLRRENEELERQTTELEDLKKMAQP